MLFSWSLLDLCAPCAFCGFALVVTLAEMTLAAVGKDTKKSHLSQLDWLLSFGTSKEHFSYSAKNIHFLHANIIHTVLSHYWVVLKIKVIKKNPHHKLTALWALRKWVHTALTSGHVNSGCHCRTGQADVFCFCFI